MQERTDKIYQRNHSLLTSLKYAVLSLCKIWADNIKNQMAFEVLIKHYLKQHSSSQKSGQIFKDTIIKEYDQKVQTY